MNSDFAHNDDIFNENNQSLLQSWIETFCLNPETGYIMTKPLCIIVFPITFPSAQFYLEITSWTHFIESVPEESS